MMFRFPTALLVAALVALPACSKQGAQPPLPSPGASGADNVSELLSVEKRDHKAPNFSWKDKSGRTVTFDQIRGKAALVNFWATWCGPCKHELPDLVALNAEMAGKGVSIIGISTDRGADVIDDVRSFVKDHGIGYQIVISSEELEEAFGNVRLLPTSFIIDTSGTIVQTFVGPRTKAFFADALLAAAR
jgi:thiol-disulfide isomerase/thioredoxin